MDEAEPHPQPNNRYGLSQFVGEQLVEYEVRTNGLGAVSLRPFMVCDDEEEFEGRKELGVPPDLIATKDLPARMTLVKRPLLERQRLLPGSEPAVSLFQGVRLVCRRVRERLVAGERGQ